MSYTEKRHSRAMQRHNDYKHIARKRNIIHNVHLENENEILSKGVHRLSDAKIHCSCPMCQSKTKTRGWKHSDRIKLDKGWDDEGLNIGI